MNASMRIKTTFLTSLMLVPAITLPAANLSSTNQPNILFILGDNWRWPTAGALGDPMARTPPVEGPDGVHVLDEMNWPKSTFPSVSRQISSAVVLR